MGYFNRVNDEKECRCHSGDTLKTVIKPSKSGSGCVRCPANADSDVPSLKYGRECFTGKLAPLLGSMGAEDYGSTMISNEG